MRISKDISCGNVNLDNDKVFVDSFLIKLECPPGPPIKKIRFRFILLMNLESCNEENSSPSSDIQIT